MKQKITTPHKFAWALLKQTFVLLGLLVPAFAQAQSTTVVISEVYAGGNTGTSAYQSDFVELYNKTGAPINLNGFSLQTNTAAGTNYTVSALGNVSIPANGFLLVRFGPTGATGLALPAPDATSGASLSPTAGRVALVSTTVRIPSGPAANGADIVDFVGYGPGTVAYEGGERAPSPSTSTSIERKAREVSTSTSMSVGGADADQGNGYDSDSNQNDFLTRATPQPQNSSSPAEVLTPGAVFYNTKNPAGTLDNLATYSSTPDGLGASPTSFSSNFQTFFISGTNRTLAANWTVSGTGSRVVLQSSASFTVPAAFSFTGTLDLRDNARLLDLNAAPGVTFDSQAASSTVEFAQAGTYTVPVPVGPGYGNLILRNGTKLLGAGTTFVQSDFLVGNVGATSPDVFGGAPGAGSTLSLNGNFTLEGTVNFSAGGNDRISLIVTNGGTTQVLDGGGNAIKLFKLTTEAGQAALRLADGTSNLELGNNLPGGGYALTTGTTFTLNNNTLSFAAGGQATIGAGNGVLALSPGTSLAFSKNGPAALGTLRLSAGSTQLTNFTLDAAGSGNTLTLPASLAVNGTLNLNTGNLTIGPGNALTLNGPLVVGNGTLRGSATSDLAINGAGALGTLSFNGGSTLRNFTLNRPGAVLALGTDMTVATALTLTNGILAIGANSLGVNGAISTTTTGLLSGSFSSDLRIGGSGPLGTVRFEATTGVLDDLVLNRPGGTLLVVGTTLQVAKPTLTAGILSLGNNVSLNVTGVLVVADPAVAQFAGTTTSGLNFTGAGAIGPLAFVPGQDVFQSLTLARTGTIPTVQLVTGLTVQNLTLTSGRIFVQGTNKLVVLPGGSLVGGGDNSYTNTLTLASVTNSTTPSVSLTFPLGVNLQYRPLTLNVTDLVIGTTSYTARQFEAPSPTRTLPPTLARVSQIRYYNVVPEAGGTSTLGTASVRLTYVAANDRVTPANISLLRVAMTDPADNTKWRDAGVSNVTTSNITSSSFPAGPLGDFTLATDINTPPNTNPLPVELTRFDAARQAEGVRLNWATASEKNSARFEVQRSLDGRTFATVATVEAQGNSSRTREYTAQDAQVPAGLLYYRLRQVDLDGTVAFSSVVTVSGTGIAGELALFPNPTTDRVTATLPAAEGRTYRVLNSLGQVLAQGDAATANPEVNVSRLPAGTYFLELRTATGRQTRRFVKHD